MTLDLQMRNESGNLRPGISVSDNLRAPTRDSARFGLPRKSFKVLNQACSRITSVTYNSYRRSLRSKNPRVWHYAIRVFSVLNVI